MTKRLQVLLDEEEYRRFQQLAKRRGLTMAEWVRQALRAVFREQPGGAVDKKVETVRAASRHQFPTGEIEQMLDEIASGYSDPD